ncbi:hypothetical protein [Saccharopolyspora rosea]|uniref:Uncharacterized protein n=1 Tax=Saccharopolyspora rosea TaxID=524884 RepID=A0ABW3FY18_9PSEU|nr:hypothetical protein [Saccharopolyspora rosea]
MAEHRRTANARAAVVAAARGERLLLHTGLADATTAAAAASAQLLTLAAVALAYAGGRPVSTLVEAPAAPGEPAALLTALVREAGRAGAIGRSLARLALPPGADGPEADFLGRLHRAWAFVVASGGDPGQVRRLLSDHRHLVRAANTRVRPDGPGRRAATADPAVLRAEHGTRPAELRRRCARLDPGGEAGRLVVIASCPPERLDALVAATAAHRPAWLTAATEPDGVRDAQRVLARRGTALAGISVRAGGGWLRDCLRLTTAFSTAHDETTGAAG